MHDLVICLNDSYLQRIQLFAHKRDEQFTDILPKMIVLLFSTAAENKVFFFFGKTEEKKLEEESPILFKRE